MMIWPLLGCIFLCTAKKVLPYKDIITAVCLPLFCFDLSQKWISQKAASLQEAKEWAEGGIKMYGKKFSCRCYRLFLSQYINISSWINIYFFLPHSFSPLFCFCTMWLCCISFKKHTKWSFPNPSSKFTL